jgi:hypothetical protein
MIARDKQLHILAGFAAGIFPAILQPGAGTAVAFLAGKAKEYDDGHGKTRGTVEKADLYFTMAGGILADAWACTAALLVLFL